MGFRGLLLLQPSSSAAAAAHAAAVGAAAARRAYGSGLAAAAGAAVAAKGGVVSGRYQQQQWQQQRRSLVVVRKKRERLTVVVDMDECLIHSKFEPMAGRRGGGGGGGAARDYAHQLLQDDEDDDLAGGPRGKRHADLADVRHSHPRGVDFFWLELEEGERVRVNMRPRVEEFLLRLSDEHDTYAFTAATECYANPVLDRLDPTGSVFKARFFRESCRPWGNLFLKDLRVVGRDLSRMVLVDNNPISFLAQPSNGIPVPSFYDDPEDDALSHVVDLIDEHLAHADDVRVPLARLFRLEEQLAPVRRQLRLHRMGPVAEGIEDDEEEEDDEEGPRGGQRRKGPDGRVGPVPPPRSSSSRR